MVEKSGWKIILYVVLTPAGSLYSPETEKENNKNKKK